MRFFKTIDLSAIAMVVLFAWSFTSSAESKERGSSYSAYLQQNANHPALSAKRKYSNQIAFVELKRTAVILDPATPVGAGSLAPTNAPAARSPSSSTDSSGSSSSSGSSDSSSSQPVGNEGSN